MRLIALDAIRFFAAFAVVLYHYISRKESLAYPFAAEFTKYGYLGVPLFFIISGFVIALSANNRTAIEFAISRFTRLYPTLWICAIFTAAATSILSGEQHSIAKIAANFTLLNEYLGYDDIDGVYWTLKAELKFYALIFIFLVFGIYEKHKIWLSIWLFSTILYTFTAQPFFMGWFITPHYSSFFIAGIALYLLRQNKDKPYSYVILAVSITISLIKGFQQVSGFITSPTEEERIVATGIIFSFFIVMYIITNKDIPIRNQRLVMLFGALTYPLYLIHNMAGKAIIDYFSTSTEDERVLIPLTISFVLLMSFLIHIYLEKPASRIIKNRLISLYEKAKSTLPISIPLK